VVSDSVEKNKTLLERLPFLRFFDSGVFIYIYVAVFSSYVAGMLRLTDHVLAANIAGYVFSGNYTIGLVFFFCAAVVYLHLARWRRWLNWQYYIWGAVVVFFPLVFFASCVKLLLNPDGALIDTLNAHYCEPDIRGTLCGQAFAALVSSMSLRALPVVLTTPAMFWYVFIRPELQEKTSSSHLSQTEGSLSDQSST